ncbi:MAG TPA: protein kinase [Blastocatellia bacterium]|nr:protein kinase [Blastocatellia bacterium]
MTPERWKRIDELLDDLLDHAPEERPFILAEVCAGDPLLKREVEALLAAHDRAGGFMESLPAQTGAMFGSLQPARGQMIGPYRVLREIGRGGMGVVYLAARADQEFAKLVAIKVVWPGANHREVLQRFRQERQILANLDHPNISRLLDGGTTEQGMPYVVMEYIAGTPITDYCDRKRLSITERLKLFLRACAVVQYAHQSLVIHRDLKPSNIMVTDEGTVKLLDFGIAKLLSADLHEVDLAVTQTGLPPMTPEYASPEQVRGDAVTTASDVYSLGVVLYELLTGHRPYKLGSRSPLELERVICDSEPERPSAIVDQVEHEAGSDGRARPRRTPETISQTREGKPDRLRARLRGDLDSIALKALRKEPAARYQSVEQFAADIRRHLEGKAVQAQRATLAYRADKFMRRHKVGVAVVALFVLMLIAGIITTTWQARLARTRALDYRRLLYAAQMNLAGQAWDNTNLERLEELLEANRPKPSEDDLRGFEWFYLWRLYHNSNERMTLYQDDQVWSVALSPDGRRLASGGEDNTARIWDVATGEELHRLTGHDRWVNAVAFSPDGKRLATASGDNTAKLWDAETGAEIASLVGHTQRVNAVVFSLDGRRLFTASHDGTVKVWDTATGREIGSLTNSPAPILSLALSPDGKRLAVTSYTSVKLWDVANGNELVSFKGHTEQTNSAKFSPDGKWLATASSDKTARLWDATTGKALGVFKGHASWVDCVAFSPDGKTLATGGNDRTIKLWDVASGQELGSLRGHLRPVESLVFSADGLRLISASLDHTVKVWDISNLKEPFIIRLGERLGAYSQVGQVLVSNSNRELKVWDVATGQERRIPIEPPLGTAYLALAPDGQRLVLKDGTGPLIVIDPGSGAVLGSLNDRKRRVYTITFSPDGRLIATGFYDGIVTLWDATTYQAVASFSAQERRVRCLAFSPDGQRLAVGGDAHEIKIWDVASIKEIATLAGHSDVINSVAFSTDGRLLASGSADLTAKLWDVATGREVRTFKGHADEVRCIALSHDGTRLASASQDMTIRLWDVATGQELIALKGHTDFVQFVAFSPDDKVLTSGSRDQTIRFWRAATPEEVAAPDTP